jgi:ribosomal protein S18 acetylase RimI-like enzyme
VAGTSGGTGLILHSPIGQAPGAPLASVVHAASAEADRRRVCFTQALLEPAARARRTMLERAGFVEAAELSYMRRAVRAAEAAGPATPAEAVARSVPGARGWRWAPQRRALFERAIEASYEDTRDCPRLVGLRSTARVLNGHMACGAGFDPQGWHVVCDETEAPVAVMLLNPASEPRTLELVYLGIARPYRGLGLGRALIGAALAMARGRGDATLRLAVDTANEPAMRLYRSMRFVPYARRAAFLHAPRLEGAEAPRRDPAASD